MVKQVSLAKRMNKKVRALYAEAHDRFHEWWYEFRVRMNWECITSLPQVLKITPPLDENNNAATVILEDDPTNQPGSVDGEGEDEEFSIPLHRSLSRTHFHTFLNFRYFYPNVIKISTKTHSKSFSCQKIQ